MKRTLLFVTSFPPRECGIATFTQDLVNAMRKTFDGRLNLEVCALQEAGNPSVQYDAPVKYQVNPFDIESCITFAHQVNDSKTIDLVCFEHEFGLYGGDYGHHLLAMLSLLDKPFIVRFHTVLPNPDQRCMKVVSLISALAAKVMVMTQTSLQLLRDVYQVPEEKLVHIPHGTHAHLVEDVPALKKQLGLHQKKVLTTFGLLSRNKGLETGITAMREIVKEHPDAVYLILGKTHPVVAARDGEQYRDELEAMVAAYGLQDNVRFINSYLSLPALLDYLTITDIYLFTSIDPDQAVSGTFVYAMSAGCAVISTAFSQAREMLDDSCCGCLIDFNSPDELATAALQLLRDPALRKQMSQRAIEKTRNSLWENVAIAHMSLIQEIFAEEKMTLPNLPPAYLDHIDRLTDEFGMIQFCRHDVPDPDSGYTLDDNARALIAMCMYARELKASSFVDSLARKYLNFISHCVTPSGRFQNYVDTKGSFTAQNGEVNLEDSNGRALWALGVVLTSHDILPFDVVQEAYSLFRPCFRWLTSLTSPRAIAFAMKGLYYYLQYKPGGIAEDTMRSLSAKLQQAYENESDAQWKWFESYMTYGNAVMPEAMMMACEVTGDPAFCSIAEESFAFLCSKTFTDNYMKVISNKSWYHRNVPAAQEGGEQSIEVAYTMLALHTFYSATGNPAYLEKMRLAFSWYLGNNHLKQLIYNPLSYGCYDGLEKTNVNQNQGAESTVCYLMARLLMEQWNKHRYVTPQRNNMEPVRIGLN